jgi:hypothetical protein
MAMRLSRNLLRDAVPIWSYDTNFKMEGMSMAKTATWLGPVLGAAILVGGYVAYDRWKEADRHDRECAALKRSFMGNWNAMSGSIDSAIGTAQREGNQSAILGVAGSVAANQVVMDTLNAKCPGWETKQYRN